MGREVCLMFLSLFLEVLRTIWKTRRFRMGASIDGLQAMILELGAEIEVPSRPREADIHAAVRSGNQCPHYHYVGRR